MKMSHPPAALTIAGSDPCTGAGIGADLRTFWAHKVVGVHAITAITAQNTQGVASIYPLSQNAVADQLEAIFSDIEVSAVKIGMLATADIVHAVAHSIAAASVQHVVLDPVLKATDGTVLLKEEAIPALIENLLPQAELVTPNLTEAERLCGFTCSDLEKVKDAAAVILNYGPKGALIKGVPTSKAEVLDVLFDGREYYLFRHLRLESVNCHGTGCVLSAAIAAGLALGRGLFEAVSGGIDYLHDAMRQPLKLGTGSPILYYPR